MTKAMAHKYEALAKYRADGHVSVLPLDMRDIALTNHVEQYKAFSRASKAEARPELDEVWLADVFDAGKNIWADFFCFCGHPDVLKAVNAEQHMLGPDHDEYWNEVMEEEEEGTGGES
jgi:hypothetical protein